MERLTRAPAPSDCSIARNACLIFRATVMFAGLEGAKKVGGTSGRPKKRVVSDELDDARMEGESAVLCIFAKRDVVGNRLRNTTN